MQLLARVVGARAGRPQIVGPLALALGLAPLVEVADVLVDHGCPDSLRDEVGQAFAETAGARHVSYHRDGRAAWIDVLVGLEELPAPAGRPPPLMDFLERIAVAWYRADPRAAPALTRWLDQQRTQRTIAAAPTPLLRPIPSPPGSRSASSGGRVKIGAFARRRSRSHSIACSCRCTCTPTEAEDL